ncbi:MAG: hypothetical protein Q8N30_02510 [Methylococcales bacterium]|nr:hypothetical protein [Methylococcales bacterium]
MKLDIHFKELEMLVSKMGASKIIWIDDVEIEVLKPEWKIVLETTGIPINIEDKDITIRQNGLLDYRGEQILLHIKDFNTFYKDLPKFHFYQCSTLNDMTAAGKLKRYVVTQRKNGTFLIDTTMNGRLLKKDKEEKLLACKNCLKLYNERYRKNYTPNDFDIATFFDHIRNTPIIYKPSHTDENAPDQDYPPNWDSIALSYKERHGWTCEQCKMNLDSHRYLLHAHHLAGVKSYQQDHDLKALCVLCHFEQPYHQHMKEKFAPEISKIKRLRGLPN